MKAQSKPKCPLCQAMIKNETGVTFLTCVNCGIWIRQGPSGVDGLYQTGWLAPLENLHVTGGTTSKLGYMYTSELIRTLNLNNLHGKRILDFGGGRGEMALALQAAGAKVIAVDPYSYMQLRAKGLAAAESLGQLEGQERFDGALAIDVIEHLTTPWEQLQAIRKLLSPDGWLYISTPNAGGLNARITRENWREARNPSHLLLFTPRAVERVLQKAGFDRYQRLRWRVDFSDNKLIQIKDWLLRSVWLDGVLRYLAYA